MGLTGLCCWCQCKVLRLCRSGPNADPCTMSCMRGRDKQCQEHWFKANMVQDICAAGATAGRSKRAEQLEYSPASEPFVGTICRPTPAGAPTPGW